MFNHQGFLQADVANKFSFYYTEETANNDEDIRKLKQIEKDISALESRKSRMTDMLIGGTITKEAYDDKLTEVMRKLHICAENKLLLQESIGKQKFESIIDKVYVGGYDEDGNPDPYKLTFV